MMWNGESQTGIGGPRPADFFQSCEDATDRRVASTSRGIDIRTQPD
jgi:hypothetical protein